MSRKHDLSFWAAVKNSHSTESYDIAEKGMIAITEKQKLQKQTDNKQVPETTTTPTIDNYEKYKPSYEQ